jgi:hypothetical protein
MHAAKAVDFASPEPVAEAGLAAFEFGVEKSQRSAQAQSVRALC